MLPFHVPHLLAPPPCFRTWSCYCPSTPFPPPARPRSAIGVLDVANYMLIAVNAGVWAYAAYYGQRKPAPYPVSSHPFPTAGRWNSQTSITTRLLYPCASQPASPACRV